MKLDFTLILLFFFGSTFLYGQELKTEKVRFRLNNLPVEEVVEIPDTKSPSIKIIAPAIKEGSLFISGVAEVELIGQVTGESEINFVLVNSQISKINDRGIFTALLYLEPGPNQIKLSEIADAKIIKESYITIKYEPPGNTLAEKIAKESKYYGLIIGIEEYSDISFFDLENPIEDAEKLYSTLTTQYTFYNENIKILKNATRAEIIQSLDDFAKVIGPSDNFLIFYAGHGWWDEDANNGYWLPSDAESHVKTNWFRNSTLVDYLKEIDSKHTLLIADACFGGSIFRTRSAFPDQEKAFNVLYELPSRKAMTSGWLTEVPDRSSFTRFLIERLTENDNKYLSSEQLFSSFRIAVINNSDALPMYGEIRNVGDQGGDFIFIKRK